MSDSLIKKTIDYLIDHSSASIRKGLLRTSLYVTKKIRETPGSYIYDVHQRMMLDNILPVVQTEKIKNELSPQDIYPQTNQIKVRIVYPSGVSWNCIGTLYEALSSDTKYQVVVVTEDFPKYIEIMKDKGCPFIRLNKYNIKEDRPDLLILTSYSYTPPQLSFEGVDQFAKTIVSLFPNIIINEFDMNTHWEYVKRAYRYCTPDYYLFDTLVYSNSEGYIEKEKAIHCGSPQLDELFNRFNAPSRCNDDWKKLNGKKVFLWATDHGLNEFTPLDAVSLDLYFKDIISYFSTHPELGLIIRFHPFLTLEMQMSGVFWSASDFNKFIEYCNNSPNIVWDNTSDYCIAFNRCDAMMIDANCGFTLSFLATGKPICRLLRNDIQTHLIHPELKDAYYYSNNMIELETFIQQTISGIDPLKEKRTLAFKNSVKHFDGKNGHRIKELIDRLITEKQ